MGTRAQGQAKETNVKTAADLRKNLPVLREGIDREIDELLRLLRDYDPLELIARYARHHLVKINFCQIDNFVSAAADHRFEHFGAMRSRRDCRD